MIENFRFNYNEYCRFLKEKNDQLQLMRDKEIKDEEIENTRTMYEDIFKQDHLAAIPGFLQHIQDSVKQIVEEFDEAFLQSLQRVTEDDIPGNEQLYMFSSKCMTLRDYICMHLDLKKEDNEKPEALDMLSKSDIPSDIITLLQKYYPEQLSTHEFILSFSQSQ